MTTKFNPLDYNFRWTSDWYEWDSKSAHETAKRERDKLAKDLKSKGIKVKKSSSSGNLMSRGGIGSGHPHVEFIVTIYFVTYED